MGWSTISPWRLGKVHKIEIGAGAVTNEAYGTGDGTTKTFTHTAAHLPVKPGTVAITVATDGWVATDDGLGNLSGTGIASGTVNYETGAMSVTYSVAPGNTHAITLNYTFGTSSAFADGTYAVRIVTTGDCHAVVGENIAVASSDSLFRAADPPEIIKVSPGERISIVQDASATGSAYVTEISH